MGEVLGTRFLGDLVVVVDDEPCVGGPLAEVFAEDLGERLDVLRRCWERSQVGTQAGVAVRDDRCGALGDAERQCGDVG